MTEVYALGEKVIELVNMRYIYRYHAEALVVPSGDYEGEAGSVKLEDADSFYLRFGSYTQEHPLYFIRTVIHTARKSNPYSQRRALEDCTERSLDLAASMGLESVGFQLPRHLTSRLTIKWIVEIMGGKFVQHLQGETPIKRIGLCSGGYYRHKVVKNTLDELIRNH